MSRSSESIIRMALWLKHTYSGNEFEFRCVEFHLSTLATYVSNLGNTCHSPELTSGPLLIGDWWTLKPHIVASFTEELKQIFMVPRLINQFQEIHQSRLIEAFLCFLLQLLYPKPDSIGSRVLENLEMELRCLLTIHQAQLADFEAVANEAGSLIHYLLFSPHPLVSQVVDERVATVFNHIHLLKATLQQSDITFIPLHTTSIVNSIPILNSLVDDLHHLLEWKDSRIADVKDQINILHKGLLLLQHSLISDVRSPHPSEIEQLKETLMRIGDIANRAESLITAYLVKDAPLWYVITTLSYLNREIEASRLEIQVTTQKYKFGGLKVTESFIEQPPLEDERKKGIIVGVEVKEIQILDQLVGGTESLQLISILGMAGLGKTTLAKKLYNHLLVRDWFDKLSWSTISQTYERQNMLAQILIQINSKLDKDKILNIENETLIEHIHKTLKGRRYLIVIDDVWDSNVWDELHRCFPEDSNGSRILLTSRNKDVIPPNSMNHELPLLLDAQCWELLENMVFGSRTCPPQLQQIGKKIAAKCRGLPLTVVVIAGVLSTVDEEEGAWEEVKGSLASYIDGEEYSVMEVLELSYKHLSDHLKPCFLHFGIYVEDEEISVRELKRLWIAEGFIRREKEKSKESVAEEYLMELIDRNLVMVGKRRSDGRGVKTCVVHDLLRDLCLKKCEDESFLQYSNNDCRNIFQRCYRLRALKDCPLTLSLCLHVRSIYGDEQITSYVGDMISLRVLDFSYSWGWYDDIFGLEYLANLRYLVIEEVPTCIDKLLNLEYIRLYSSRKVCIPPTIVNLKKLRYFGALGAEYRYDWSSEGESNSLEYLSRVVIKVLKDEELLRRSPHLLKLRCIYKPNRETLLNEEYPRFDLSFLTQLGSLSLSYLYKYTFEFGFPPNIRKLSLISSNIPWENLSIVGRLENLEVLKFKHIFYNGKRWDTRDGEFQKLKFLLFDKVDLFEWNVASSEHFPQLRQLVLINCYYLHEIPREFGEITTLELIEVEGYCRDSMLESAERIKREQWEMGNEEFRLREICAYKGWP